MAAKTSLSQFDPFFGGDKKGAYLIQAMYNGTDYTHPTEEKYACFLTELMKAENHNNYQSVRSSTGAAQGPNDVPQDFTDLIITTALYHRLIDQSARMGSKYAKYINDFPEMLRKYLDDTSNLFDYSSLIVAKNISNVYPEAKNNSDRILCALADAAITRNHTAAQSIPYFFSTDTNEENLIDAINKHINILTSASVASEVKIELKDLIKDMAKQMEGIYRNVKFKDSKVGDYSVDSVKDFLQDRGINHRQNLESRMKKAVNEGLKKQDNTARLYQTTLDKPVPRDFFDKVFGQWSELGPDIREFYYQNVGLFAKRGSGLYVDSNARDQQLGMGWRRMTYTEVDDLLDKSKNKLTPANLANLRVNLMKSAETGYVDVIFGSNLPDVPKGANVWYTDANNQAARVPSPPVDFFRQLYNAVYITAPVGSSVTVTIGSHVLKVNADHATRQHDAFDFNYGKFLPSIIKCIENLRGTSQPSTPGAKPKPGTLDYPFLKAYDMVYGKLWTYDDAKDMYYRIDETGKKCWYNDEAKSNTKTCYATYLGQGDKSGVKCERIIKCIADGNYQSLHRCLDVIGDEGDLWEVAADDVAKVGPDMIRLVLRKFKVKGEVEPDGKGGKYIIPITFERWMRDVVEKDISVDPNGYEESVRKAIKKNDHLLNYIRGLINVCRANPSIINKTNVNIIKRDKTPDYFKNLYPHIKPFRFPHVDKKTSEYELIAKMMTDTMVPNYPANNGLFNPITSGYFSNVSMMSPYSTQFPGMLGGTMGVVTPVLPSSGTSIETMNRQGKIVKHGSSNQFGRLIATIDDAFNDVGLQLHPDDQAKLLGVVKKLESYEAQLAKMCTILIGIVQIARFFGVSLENVDREHPKQLRELNTFQSINDIHDFVRNYARDLHKNMINNVNIQQGVSYELMGKVFPRMWCDLAGKTSGDANASVPATASVEPPMVDF